MVTEKACKIVTEESKFGGGSTAWTAKRCYPAICCTHKAQQLACGSTAEHQVLYAVAVVVALVLCRRSFQAGAEARAVDSARHWLAGGQGALHIAPSLMTREAIGRACETAIGEWKS